MNVVVFASRKGGSGKSTLAAHLAAHVHRPSRPCLLIDSDPQGSLTLWHKLRNAEDLPLRTTQRGIPDIGVGRSTATRLHRENAAATQRERAVF